MGGCSEAVRLVASALEVVLPSISRSVIGRGSFVHHHYGVADAIFGYDPSPGTILGFWKDQSQPLFDADFPFSIEGTLLWFLLAIPEGGPQWWPSFNPQPRPIAAGMSGNTAESHMSRDVVSLA